VPYTRWLLFQKGSRWHIENLFGESLEDFASDFSIDNCIEEQKNSLESSTSEQKKKKAKNKKAL